MNKTTSKRTSLVLSVFSLPILAAILILSVTGVGAVIADQKSGENKLIGGKVLSDEDSKELKVTDKPTTVGEKTNGLPKKDAEKNTVTTKTTTKTADYTITVKGVNPNSNGLAATERVKIQLRKNLDENPEFLNKIQEVQMVLETSASSGSVQYRAVATKSEKLFGIFKISIPVQMSVDEDGNITQVNQGLVQRILGILSF